MVSQARQRSGKGKTEAEPVTVRIDFGDRVESVVVDRESFTFREEHRFSEACAEMTVYRDGVAVEKPTVEQRLLAAAWVVRCRSKVESFDALLDRLNARSAVSVVADEEDNSPEG